LGEIELFKQNVNPAFNIPPNVRVKANRTGLRNGVVMYQFAMNPKDLAELAYVARRDVRDKAFYQRQIDKGRIEEIGRYISNPDNLLVNNIILAFDELVTKPAKNFPNGFIQFPKGRDQGVLKFPLDFKCCWIIDGQHRFYGFRHATKDMKVPIAVLQGLDPVKQAEIFLHINEFQKAVKPELVWDLKDELMFPSTDAMISRTLKKVNSDGIDGIKYTIGIPSQVKNPAGMKKFAAMCTALSDLKLATPATSSGRANPYWKGKNDTTVNQLFKGINEFFNAMKQVFPEDFARGHAGFVLGEGSGIVMLSLFERIIQYSIDRSAVTYPDPDENSPTFGQQIPVELDHSLFVHCLTPIKDEIEDWTTDTTEGDENQLTVARSTCGNKTGQSRYLTSFVRTIRKAIKDETFALGLQGLPEHRDYKLAEEEAHELLEEVLKPKFGEDWLVKSTNSPQYNAIKGTATRKAKNIDPHLYHKYATVGQSSEIILGHIDDFADVFLTGKFSFANKDELKVALAKLRQYKADGSHIQPGIGSKTDAQIADSYLVKFKDCIAFYMKEKVKQAAATIKSTLVADPNATSASSEQTPESTDQSSSEK
jgi:DGQHR domain-containing protein